MPQGGLIQTITIICVGFYKDMSATHKNHAMVVEGTLYDTLNGIYNNCHEALTRGTAVGAAAQSKHVCVEEAFWRRHGTVLGVGLGC